MGAKVLIIAAAASFTCCAVILVVLNAVPDIPDLLFYTGIGIVVLLCVLVLRELYACTAKARRNSEKMGLTCIVLVPLKFRWAKVLVMLSAGKICGGFRRAYEIHINPKAVDGIGKKELLKRLTRDLKKAEKDLPGSLFIWESHIRPPKRFRQLIKELAPRGKAYFHKAKGPFTALYILQPNLRKNRDRVWSGAVLLDDNEWAKGGMSN